MKKALRIIIALGIVAVVAAGFAYAKRGAIRDAIENAQREPLPEPVGRQEFENREEPAQEPETPAVDDEATAPTNDDVEPTPVNEPPTDATPVPQPEPKPEPAPEPAPANEPLPAEFNLKVPFIVQAPHANWDEVHEDACEEASAAMVYGYLSGDASYTADQMEAAIMKVVAYENETLGYNKDTSAAQTAAVMEGLYGYEDVRVLPVSSWNDVKAQLVQGRPVIVPAYGKALFNPYFSNGGPEYHMLVIKGWTDTKIITNDPGTRRGADFLYDPATLMNALHDWNGGDVPNGEKVMIVVFKE